jgi:hypothetical protein
MSSRAYLPLLGLTVIAAVGGVLTLVPAAQASWENVLGYRSWCTFTPASTLFCFLVAGGSCTLRASLVKRRAIFGKPVFRAAPIVVLSLVSILAVASTAWYVRVDSAFHDGTTSATIEE